MKKRLWAVVLVIGMVLGMAGCQSDGMNADADKDGVTVTQPTTTAVTVEAPGQN